jgi:ketosteroid isomerase-like protein
MSRMSLRAPLLVVGLLVSTAMLASCNPAPAPADAVTDTEAVKQMLVDWYRVYSTTDEARYKAFVADEYALLENGTIMGLEDDLKSMRERPPGYRRTDAFDFRSVRLHGDLAYATYFLESEIADDTKIARRKWLESALLRRVEGRWRCALLHSTRISATETPRQAPAPATKPAA